MILIELMFGMALALFLLLVLPLLLLMAGIASAMLLWYLAPAVLVAALLFWLIFPGSHGLALVRRQIDEGRAQLRRLVDEHPSHTPKRCLGEALCRDRRLDRLRAARHEGKASATAVTRRS